MSVWETIKKYAKRTPEFAEKTGYAIGKKAGEYYERRWGEGGREERIAAYKAKTKEVQAKYKYVQARQRLVSVKQKRKSGFDSSNYITGGKPTSKNDSNKFDHIVGKSQFKKMKEFDV